MVVAYANRRTLETTSRFGRRIARLRTERNLHLSDLAGAIGAHPNTILNWETDKVDPPMSKVVLLARLFGVSLDYLVLGKEAS